MTDQSYRVVFEGLIADGFSVGQVKQNLAKLFKADEARIASIFSGQAVVLKKNTDEATALKYQAALRKAGALTVIRDGSAGAQAVNARTSTGATEAATPNPEQTDEWSLAPVGSLLLSAKERSQSEELAIDLSHISLASSFLSPEPQASAAPPMPDTGHISIAEPGASLGSPDNKADSVTQVEELNATLAPVGAELGEQKTEAEAPALDLSHLSVEENN